MVTLYPLLLSDDRAVPGAEHCDVHNADMAAGDRVRPRLRRPHAQNVAVSQSGGRCRDYAFTTIYRVCLSQQVGTWVGMTFDL